MSHRKRAAGPAEPGREAGGGAGPAAGSPPGGFSWQVASTVSAPVPKTSDLRVSRRDDRYDLQAVLWKASSLERIRACRRRPLGDVKILDNAGVAHYSGLETCGSIHACPGCSAKIRAERSLHVSTAAASWDRRGNSVWMVTFTAPHDMGMRLRDLYPVIANSFREVLNGNRWYRVKKLADVVGNIRAMETTYGDHGWHPHLHVLFFLRGEPGAAALAEFVTHLRKTWGMAITKAGYRLPSHEHGVMVDRCRSAEEAGRYICKTQDGEGAAVGNELARGDMKDGRGHGRAPFQILRDFREAGLAEFEKTGEVAGDLALWREYEQASKGHKAITPTPGLWALLEVTEEIEDAEQSDEQLAAKEVGGQDVVLLPRDVWQRVVNIRRLPAHLLYCAEQGGARSVLDALEFFGIGVPPDPGLTGSAASDIERWRKRQADAEWSASGGDRLLTGDRLIAVIRREHKVLTTS